MMQRAPKYCAENDCLELLTTGINRCPKHARTWSTSRRHPRGWTTIRARIMARDKWTCYVCGRQATDVDHIDNLGSDEDSNLAAICPECHRKKTQTEALESQLTRPPM